MMRKRLLSILLTACMVLSLMPAAAWAAGETATAPGGRITDEGSAKTAFGTANVTISGNTITLKTDIRAGATLPFYFESGDWTLDLGGHTITGPDGYTALVVGEDATLTLTSTEGGAVRGGGGGWSHAAEVSGTLTLDGAVALTGGVGDGAPVGGHGVLVHGTGALAFGENAKPKLTGGSGDAAGAGIFCESGSTLTIGAGAAPVCTGGPGHGSFGILLNIGVTVEGTLTDGMFAPDEGSDGSAIVNSSGCSLLAPGYGFYKEDGDWVEESDRIAPAVEVKALGGDITAETTADDVTNLFGGGAALEGDTITLTDDVTLGAGLVFQSSKWTLDLNGHTLLELGDAPALLVPQQADLTLTGPGGVTGGPGSPAVSMGFSALTLAGELTLTGGDGDGENGQGGHALLLAANLSLTLADDLDLTCIGGSGTSAGGDGVGGNAPASITGTLSKGRFEGGAGGSKGMALGEDIPLPLAEGAGYFVPGEDREYYFDRGEAVPQVLEVREVAQNIRVEYIEGETTVSRVFGNLRDMKDYYEDDFDGKDIQLLNDVQGNLDSVKGSFTLDGNGHTLKRNDGVHWLVRPNSSDSDATVALKDVTLDGTFETFPPVASYYPEVIFGSGDQSITLEAGATAANGGKVVAPPPDPPAGHLPKAGAVMEGGTLNLMADSSVRENLGKNAGGVSLSNAATLTMEGGSITGNLGVDGPGGVVVDEDCAFTMDAGEIAGNGSVGEGTVGGVEVRENGVFTMNGGTIRQNTGLEVGGVETQGTFIMNGGSVTGNRAAMPAVPEGWRGQYRDLKEETLAEMEAWAPVLAVAGGVFAIHSGRVFLSGDATIRDNTLWDGTPSNLVLVEMTDGENTIPAQPVIVTGELTGSIGVSLRMAAVAGEDVHVVPTTGVVARGATVEDGGEPYTLTEGDLAAFFSDNPDYELKLDTGTNTITLASRGVAAVGDRYYPTVADALAAAADGQTVRLLQSGALQDTLVIDKKVTLDLNGCTLTAGAEKNAIEVIAGGVLTLHDDSGAGEVVGGGREAGDSAAAGSGVLIGDGGKLILSGRVRATGGVHAAGVGGPGVNCQGTLALAPGAEPTLTGGEGRESGKGGAGLFLGDGGDVEGFLTGGTYVGGPGGITAGYGLEVQWNDYNTRPALSGGCYKGINMHTGETGLPALLPDYCYYADEDGDKLNPQPSSQFIYETVTVARRGGPVHDIYEFQAALGGAEFARINAGTSTVVLEGDVELAAPVEIAAGSYTLDLYGYSITGAPGAEVDDFDATGASDGKPALVLNGAGVALTVMDSDFDDYEENAVTGGAGGSYYQSKKYNAEGGGGILVTAGALTVTGDAHVTGGESTGDNSGGYGGYGVRVTGGSLTLTGTPTVTGGVGKVDGGEGILVGTAGKLRVPQGAWPTVAGGDGDSESSSGYGIELWGTAQIAGGSYFGCGGIYVSNRDYGALTITGGSFTGSSLFGCNLYQYRQFEISGGTFRGGEGYGAVRIKPWENGAYKRSLSGGSFLGEKAIWIYKPEEDRVDGDATPADLLAEGYHFYNEDGNVVADLTGTQEGNDLILAGRVTVGAARWTEFTDTGWYDGHEADESYTLTTAEALAGLAELVNGGNSFGSKTVKLGADIDLSAHDWVPIAGNSGVFGGEFDGQGHAVTGMNVTGNWECAGLFGAVGGGTVHDLALAGNVSVARTSGAAFVGGVAGSVSGISEVYNVLFTGTVSLDGKNGLVGGLVGQMETSSTDMALRNSAALAEVSGGFAASPGYSRNAYVVYAGGLVGGISAYQGETAAVINNCYAAGTVAARPGARFVWCGALVGNAMGADEKTDHLYYLDTMGDAVSDGTLTNAPTAMTQADMQSAAFADTLNAWVDAQDEGAGYAKWYAHAGAYPDFTKPSGGSTGGTSGSGTTTTKTETNPDGSKTTTVTDKKTGAVTETTRAENGVEAVVKTEKNGAVTAAVTVPQEALTPPEEGPLPVVEVPGRALPTGEGAPAIAVTLPDGLDTAVIVAIPVADGTVVLRGDGTPIALSVVEDGRAYVVLVGSEELNIVTAGGFFDDVAGAAGEAADFGAARALWTGTGEREFSPEMPMDRAMLATVLWRLDGAEDPGSVELFPDVPEGAWFADAVAWGGKSGVIQGTGAGFAPDVALTAEQMLVMLYRYTTYADLLVPAGDGTGVQAPEGTASWAADAIAWAINAGLVRLGEDGDLTAPITRAEAAALLQGYVQYLVKR